MRNSVLHNNENTTPLLRERIQTVIDATSILENSLEDKGTRTGKHKSVKFNHLALPQIKVPHYKYASVIRYRQGNRFSSVERLNNDLE